MLRYRNSVLSTKKGGIELGKPAERIMKYIKENGIKQTFISQKTGIKKSTLSAKLRGQAKISAEEIELICWALNCSPTEFISPKSPEKAGA